MLPLAILLENSSKLRDAEKLADTLKIPITQNSAADFQYFICFAEDSVSLLKSNSKITPLKIDFSAKEMLYRKSQATTRKEVLARALGLKMHVPSFIIDGTAGLGRDSFILACLGFTIHLIERSPILHALLKNGLERAALNPNLTEIISRMHLHLADTGAWLENLKIGPDIIYLDPMFPPRDKSALVKKEMQILHDILGSDTNAHSLLDIALARARKRVVVKRPRLAPFLSPIKPSLSMTGKSCRFDIYLPPIRGC